MADPWDHHVERIEAQWEESHRTPEEQAKFDAMLQEYSDREADLDERFTFDGTRNPWKAVREAISRAISAKKHLTPVCRAGPEPKIPEWQEQARDKLYDAIRLLQDAETLLENNPS